MVVLYRVSNAVRTVWTADEREALEVGRSDSRGIAGGGFLTSVARWETTTDDPVELVLDALNNRTVPGERTHVAHFKNGVRKHGVK